MLRFTIAVLLLTGLAQAEPWRDETRRVLKQELEARQYRRMEAMLDERFDAEGALRLTPREESDLRALLGDLPAELTRRYRELFEPRPTPPVPDPARTR